MKNSMLFQVSHDGAATAGITLVATAASQVKRRIEVVTVISRGRTGPWRTHNQRSARHCQLKPQGGENFRGNLPAVALTPGHVCV